MLILNPLSPNCWFFASTYHFSAIAWNALAFVDHSFIPDGSLPDSTYAMYEGNIEESCDGADVVCSPLFISISASSCLRFTSHWFTFPPAFTNFFISSAASAMFQLFIPSIIALASLFHIPPPRFHSKLDNAASCEGVRGTFTSDLYFMFANLFAISASACSRVMVSHSFTGRPFMLCCPYPIAHQFTSQYGVDRNHSFDDMNDAGSFGIVVQAHCP